ncbi:tetratricopeptide repeat protein [uncultured Microbulbifer sp.]|uniref:tetratricopeptide repeat protein n=1 Tax=uncultured Microbulbifer sp. TaxID=348147 RepID=UPI0025E9980B|nr:tetratricopeptide repeat protein [uncultured Microbulbifer sp.]
MTTLRFGEFELDREQPCLRRRGKPVSLQDLPLRLLTLLVSHPGEILTREVLFQHFWPDDATGILDDNLNTLVRKLRQALNDSARSSRFIETVPKKGYRFIAPVRPVAMNGDGVSGDGVHEEAIQLPVPAPAPRVGYLRHPGIVLACIALLGLFAAAGFHWLSAPGTASQPADRKFGSVAVLPFVNASENHQRDYFSDGLADDLLNRLSGFRDLRVVSRTSSFAMGESGLDARRIGEQLESDALVEGSVRRDGEQLRINVRLIDTRSGFQLWSQSYQRELGDIFALQQEIALEIAGALAGELHEDHRAARANRIPPAAYDDYLKGRFYWHKRSAGDLKKAAGYFEAAIARAPDYAPAWAGLADAFAVQGFYDYMPPAEAFSRAKGAARRALQLDPRSASAEANLGYVALYHEWDFVEAEARFRQSIAINPAYSKAHQWYANLLVAAGRFDEAEREMRRATELDPLSLIANAALGWVLYHAGSYQAALDQLAVAQELDPDFELIYLWQGWILEKQGDLAGAIAALRECVARSGGSGISVASLARVLALSGQREEARALLETLVVDSGYQPSYEIAKAYLGLGDAEEGERWLRSALAQRSHSMVFLNVDPQLAAYRDTPQHAALTAQVFVDN